MNSNNNRQKFHDLAPPVGQIDPAVLTYFVPGKLYRAKRNYYTTFWDPYPTSLKKDVFFERDDVIMFWSIKLDEKLSSSYADDHVEVLQRCICEIIAGGKKRKMTIKRDERDLFSWFEKVQND